MDSAKRERLEEIYRERAKHLISSLDDETVVLLACAMEAVRKGFRIPPDKSAIRIFRSRLTAAALPKRTPDRLRTVLYERSLLGQSFLAALSLSAIELALPEIVTVFGRDETVFALMLDDRDEVGRLAEEALDVAEPGEDREREEACQRFSKQFLPFLQCLGKLAPKDGEVLLDAFPVSESIHRDEPLEGLREENRALKDELARLETGKHKAERSRDKLQEKLDARSANRALDEKSLQKLRKENSELRKQVSEMERSAQERADRELKSSLRSYLSPLLRESLPPSCIPSSGGEGKGIPELLRHSEEILKRQGEADRVYGVRSALYGSLKSLDDRILEINRALSDSIHPLQDLIRVREELMEERDRIADHLDSEKSGECPPVDFLSFIRACQNTAQLERMEALLINLHDHRILSARDYRSLRSQWAERKRLLLDLDFVNRDLPSAPPPDPVQALYRVIRNPRAGSGESAVLLVDGHNVIGLRYGSLEKEWEHRPALIENFRALLLKEVSLHIELFFDSRYENFENVEDHLQVFYSGGLGRNRADLKILERLEFHSRFPDPRRKIFIVTADRALAAQCREDSAQIINPVDFDRYILGLED